MDMSRITLTISPEEHQALQIVAQQERRDPRQEAAWLLCQALEQRGLLLPGSNIDGDDRDRQAAEIVEVKEVAPFLLQTKLVAFGQRAEVVLRSHVDEARNIILSARKQAGSQGLRITLGSVLLGAFAQGFIYEISLATLRPFWITIYVVAGFVGLFLVLWGH